MSIVEQIIELNSDFADSLKRLHGLIANRSAWSDGIEGCRETLVLLTDAARKLKTINEAAAQLESDLTIARSEIATWTKVHADLSIVENDLRTERDGYRAELSPLKAELTRLKKKQSEWLAAEKKLRTERDQYRQALEERADTIANARSLAKRLINETTA